MLACDATISGTRILLHASMTLHVMWDTLYFNPLLRRLRRMETLDAQISSRGGRPRFYLRRFFCGFYNKPKIKIFSKNRFN
jgi:hypothetical protein